MFFKKRENSRGLATREIGSLLGFTDRFLIDTFRDVDQLISENRERSKIWKIEEAINLAKERLKLKDEIIGISREDPRFLEELKEVLDRLGL